MNVTLSLTSGITAWLCNDQKRAVHYNNVGLTETEVYYKGYANFSVINGYYSNLTHDLLYTYYKINYSSWNNTQVALWKGSSDVKYGNARSQRSRLHFYLQYIHTYTCIADLHLEVVFGST